MNKKILALLTSFLMIASAAAPAYADAVDTTEQTAIVQDSNTESADAADNTDVSEPEISQADAADSVENTDEVVAEAEDSAEEDEDTAEEAEDSSDAAESEDHAVEDEEADAPADETTDTASSDNDALLDDEEEYYADKDWMRLEGTVLTIKGEIKDIGTDGLKIYWSGVIDVTKITEIRTESGAKAPAVCFQLFDSFTGLQKADLSNLDVSNVQTMKWMFYGCSKLTTVNVTGWKPSKLTNMQGMFSGCSKLTTVTGMNAVTLSNISTMENMYSNCSSLTHVDTPFVPSAKAVNVNRMFQGCSSLKSVYWNINANTSSTWTDTFSGCANLKEIRNWVGTVTIPASAKLPNSINERWYKYADSGYVCMSGSGDSANFIMLAQTYYYRRSWYVWDSSTGTITIQGLIPEHGTQSIPDLMGITASSIKTVKTVNGAHTSTSASDLFDQCTSLTTANLGNLDLSSCTTFLRTFRGCSSLTSVTMPSTSTATVYDMRYMFADCPKLKIVNLSKFVFSASLYNTDAFRGCSGLTTLVLPANFKVVTEMKLPNYSADYGYFGWKMSNNASSVSGTGEYAAFNVGSANTYYRVLNWFKWDSSSGTLTIQGAVPSISNKNIAERTGISDITSSSVKKVTSVSGAEFPENNTSYMFYNMSAMTSADLSKVDTYNSTSFLHLFDGCSALTSVNLSNWSTNNVKDLEYMFNGCSKLTKIDISSFNVSNVKFGSTSYIKDMFKGCSALNTLVLPSGFIVKADMSLTNKPSGYIGWAKSGTTTVVSGSGTYAEFNVGSNTTYVRVSAVQPTSVSLNKTSMTLTVGGTDSLTATVLPTNATDKSVTWSTSSSSVATVSSDGIVTAKGAGTCTITAKTSNGKSATCTVKVEAPVVNPTSVSLNRTTATLNVGGTITLTPTVSPSNATNKSITWNTSSSSIATVSSSGVVTAKAEGTATITASTFNGKSATCTITVNSTVVDPTGITLNKTSTTIAVGATETLTATIKPDNATNHNVTWTSSATDVATVSNGVVTAKKPGTAVITAAATAKPSIKTTCTVTVAENKPAKPTVVIKTAFGGRTVTFNCADTEAEIYYNFGSSNITTSCKHVKAGGTIFLNEPMTGNKAAMYFKSYKDGKWSDVAKWGVLNVQIAKPIIVVSGKAADNNFRIYTQTSNSYIVYTLDGTVPSIKEGTAELKVDNGRLVWGTSTIVNIPKGRTIKAIAIRNGLVTSEIMEFTNE